jgi:hypothetical protein
VTASHKEELRSRLYFIKQGLLRIAENQEYIMIQDVFSDNIFREVCDVLDVVNKLPEASIDSVV